jgi:DNA repair protein RadC
MSSEITPKFRITDLSEDDRPRERLERLGPSALSSAELLAILLRVGVKGENAVKVGERLITKFNGVTGIHRASFAEVCDQHGLGRAKAAQIKAALELGNRLALEALKEQRTVSSPEDAAALVMYDMSFLEYEELRVILLDTRNRVIEIAEVYKGSVNSSQVRICELFRNAIRRNAVRIILLHNHPSGDPTPSPDDIAVTRAIVQAGALLEIEVLDHLVIGNPNFVSLKERGLGFG